LGWNSLDELTPETRLLHYTKIKTQPWVYPGHPLGHLWSDEVKRMLADGTLDEDLVRTEVAAGHLRPSLLLELGLDNPKGKSHFSAEEMQRHDRMAGFVIHKKLFDDMHAKEVARREHERLSDPAGYNRRRRQRLWRNFYRHPIRFLTNEKLRS
jgi:hypothetical protein